MLKFMVMLDEEMDDVLMLVDEWDRVVATFRVDPDRANPGWKWSRRPFTL